MLAHFNVSASDQNSDSDDGDDVDKNADADVDKTIDWMPHHKIVEESTVKKQREQEELERKEKEAWEEIKKKAKAKKQWGEMKSLKNAHGFIEGVRPIKFVRRSVEMEFITNVV